MSAINAAIEAVIGLMNQAQSMANVTRGALPTGNGLCCEIGPSSADQVYLDKNVYVPINLVLNGKHENLKTLSDAMDKIHGALAMAKTYPTGNGWQIVDIANYVFPQVIGRNEENKWLMASTLSVRLYLGV